MQVTAILVVRNEKVYIEETIKYLINNKISIVIIDRDLSITNNFAYLH